MILQTDPSWLANRRGRLTASRMADAMDFLKNGKEGAARKRYKVDLVGERSCDYAVDHYVSPAMQRGIDNEPLARSEYEDETGLIAGPAALVDHPEIDYFSATPDGFIGTDGLLEIKVPSIAKFIEWKISGVLPEEHEPQVLAQLACTQRKWTDFCAFCPEMQPGKRLLIVRFVPTELQIQAIEKAAVDFLEEVDAMFDAFHYKKEA